MVLAITVGVLQMIPQARATLKFWGGTGTWTTANTWSLTSGGTLNQTWVAGDTAQFDVANSTITYVTGTQVAGMTANQNVTMTAAGTFNTGGTVMPITVASGMTLNLAAQSISVVAGTGLSKSGPGALFSANGNAYLGGFTLNQGYMIAGGVNAMGAGGALTINGGAIGGNATRDFSGKYTSGISVGGDFQLGVLVGDVALSSSTANLTFNNNMSLGASTRTVTIGANGAYTLGGIISGSPGVGLTVDRLAGATGKLVLTAANTYEGDTTITGGILSLGSVAILGNSTGIIKLNGGNLAANETASRTVPNPITMAADSIVSGIGSTGSRGNTARFINFSTSTFVNNGGTLTVRNIGGASGTLFGLRFTGGGFTFSRPISLDLNTDAGLAQLEFSQLDAAGDQTFSGIIANGGTGNGNVLRNSTGTTILTGANSYKGGTWLVGGFLGLGIDSVGAPPTLTSGPIGIGILTNNDAATLGIFASGGARTVGNTIAFGTLAHSFIIKGANSLTLSGSIALGTLPQTFQVDNTADTTLAGSIGGGATTGVSFTKTGNGKLILTGNNTNTGAMLISAGALLVNNTSGSGTSTGAVTVASGATLGGNGIILGAVTNNFGGTIQPGLGGTNTATLTISNNLSLAGNALFNLNRTNAQNSSKISGLATVTCGGTLTLTNIGEALQAGDTFTLFTATTYSGGFTNIILPAIDPSLVWVTNTLSVNGSVSVILSSVPTTLALVSSANPSGFLDSINFTGVLAPTNGTGSITFLTNGTPLSTNNLILGNATSATVSNLPRGTNLITAIYTGDGFYLPSTNTLSQIITNHPPVAGNTNYSRVAGITTLHIKISDLLAGLVSDTDGDTVTLTSTATSTNGITLVNDGTFLHYQNTNAVNDQFTYTVTDSFGDSATGLANIVAAPFATGQNATVTVSGSTATVGFAGIPGYSYDVQRSTNLTAWVSILTTNAPPTGAFEWTDDFSDLGVVPSSAYYRLQWNP